MFHLIKNGVKTCLNKLPSAYPSNRVTYGEHTVKDELDEINSDLTAYIGESTSGQTWEQQLTAIGALYSNLTSTQKMRSFILDSGGYRYSIQDINTGGYGFTETTASSVEIDSFNVTSHKFISAKYSGSTWSITDKSNETLNRRLILYA